MKFTVKWLKQPLDTKTSVDEIVTRLTAIGHEVEEVINRADMYKTFTIAHVKDVVQHPDADRLKVCTVDTGSEELQIVCGAPNAKKGIKVVLARAGDYIPGIDVTLKKTEIRGVESNGMMCSENELCLSDMSDGIIELPEDAPVGGSYMEYAGLDDVLIDVAITPNRGDAASVYGIARDLAASGLGTLNPVPTDPIKGTFKSDVAIEVQSDSGCPHFVGRMIKGVKNGPSPEWLQQLLIAIGLRPISALVDITNFFTHDLGRPLHVYDAKKIGSKLIARKGKAGEILHALNDKEYKIDETMCVIADENKVLGLGGIMGGIESGCSSETTDIVLESAWFDPNIIACTGRTLEIISDARYRFERGVDPAFTKPAIELATKMIVDLCGGEVSDVVEAGTPVIQKNEIKYDPQMMHDYVGMDVSAKDQKSYLEKLGCVITGDKIWTITTPSWRPDLVIKHDIAEEIARLEGLDKIKPAYLPPLDENNPYKPHDILTPLQKAALHAKKALASYGFQETVNYSFISEKEAGLFANKNDALILTNAISAHMNVMRPSVLPSLLQVVSKNCARGFNAGSLFEFGPVFHGTAPNNQPYQLSAIHYGALKPRHWRGSDVSRNSDMTDLKGDAIAVLEDIGFPTSNLRVLEIEDSRAFHPGQSGALALGKDIVARFGAVHPDILDAFDIKARVSAFEIEWPAVCNILGRKNNNNARPPLKLFDLQSVTRDFAFLMNEETEIGDLSKAILNADKKLITDVRVFDIYQGKGMEEGKKSVAVEVTLQPIDKSLTDEDLKKVTTDITSAALKSVGAVIRG